MNRIFKLCHNLILGSFFILASSYSALAADRMNADWVRWKEDIFGKTWVSWCGGIKDDEWEWMSIIQNDRQDLVETRNAQWGCGLTLHIVNRILGDEVANKKWFQGRLYSHYVGTHDYYSDRKDVKLDFLKYGDDKNYTVWFMESLDNEGMSLSEAVVVPRIKNKPDNGIKFFNGTVGFGGVKFRENLDFASIDFAKKTITINSKFEGFGATAYGRETYSISSSPLALSDWGYFEGNLNAYHHIPGAGGLSRSYQGTINGYLGGDGGNLLIALYDFDWGHKSIDFFMGSAK